MSTVNGVQIHPLLAQFSFTPAATSSVQNMMQRVDESNPVFGATHGIEAGRRKLAELIRATMTSTKSVPSGTPISNRLISLLERRLDIQDKRANKDQRFDYREIEAAIRAWDMSWAALTKNLMEERGECSSTAEARLERFEDCYCQVLDEYQCGVSDSL